MDTMNTRDEAQTGARIALRNGAEGSASEADIEDAARIAVDNYDRTQSVILNVRDIRNAITEAMGTDTQLRGIRVLRDVVMSLASYDGRIERRDRAWQVIAEVRDRHPRVPEDASTDDIVEALIEAGLLR